MWPYTVRLIIDFTASSGLWVALFLFKILTGFLEIEGWASRLIVWLHSVGVVGCFLFLSQSLVRDFCHIRAVVEGGHDHVSDGKFQ